MGTDLTPDTAHLLRAKYIMDTDIPDFTDAERRLASASLFERYGKLVQIQLAVDEL